jgi:hypothetical protein
MEENHEGDQMGSSFSKLQETKQGSKVEALDEISALFFGKEIEYKSFVDARTDKLETHQNESSTFCQLLNVCDHNDMYSAWEDDKRT